MSNPVLANPSIPNWYVGETTRSFTAQGVAIKTLVLLAVMSVTFAYTWSLSTVGYSTAFAADSAGKIPDAIDIPSNVIGLAVTGCIGAFVVAMITIFNQRSAPFMAPIYAALEGLALGAISAGFEAKYPGIVLEAMLGVCGTAMVMNLLYSSGILRPTQGFMVGLLAAMGGILVLYFADIIMQMNGSYISVVHSSGPWGIALQTGIVLIAALNFIIDFGNITEAAENRAPKWYEWYAAFGLMLTIVWLYLEMLQWLAKLKGNDD